MNEDEAANAAIRVDENRRSSVMNDTHKARDIGADHMVGIDTTSVSFWLKDALRSDQPVSLHWNKRGQLEMQIGTRTRATFDRGGGHTIHCDAKP